MSEPTVAGGVNKGVETVMNFGVMASRVGSLTDRQARAEMRGIAGVLNIEFTGPDGGGWHLAFDDGDAKMGKGLVAEPRSTVRVKPQDYLAMLAGDLSPSVARMTGRLRVAGDPNLGSAFGTSLGGFRALEQAPGLRGWIGRRVISRALRVGGYEKATPKNSNPPTEISTP